MKKFLPLYAGYIIGVLSLAGIAYWYWVQHFGEGHNGNENAPE